jgi:hypothetical protein
MIWQYKQVYIYYDNGIQVIVHDGYMQADLVHVLRGDVEDDSFVIGGVQSVPLDGGFPLF